MIDSRSFAPSSVIAWASRMAARLGTAARTRARPAYATGPQSSRPGVWGLLAGDLHDRSR